MTEQYGFAGDDSELEVRAEALFRSLDEPELDLSPEAASVRAQLAKDSFYYVPKQPLARIDTHYVEINLAPNESYLIYPLLQTDERLIVKRVERNSGAIEYLEIVGSLKPDDDMAEVLYGLGQASDFMTQQPGLEAPTALEMHLADQDSGEITQEVYLISREHFLKDAFLVTRPVITREELDDMLDAGARLEVEPHRISIQGVKRTLYIVLEHRMLQRIKGVSSVNTSGVVEDHFGTGTTPTSLLHL